MTLPAGRRFSGTLAVTGALAVLLGWVPTAGLAADPPDPAAAIADRVAADLPEEIVTQHSAANPLAAAMRRAGVPSVSMAVFIDGTLAWSRAWGMARPDTGTAATPDTLYQAASISKPVAALAAMKLVSEGRLELDTDVSHAIPGWTAARPITLRQLLSHSSGLGVSGFAGYADGAILPTALQVLNGAAPANSAPVKLDYPTAQDFHYSGGGYTAVQLLIEQASGQSFADAVAGRVLTPLGLPDATFAQPLDPRRRGNAAAGFADGKPLPGGSNSYPELAAAGLWATPRDLGRIAVDMQRALRGEAGAVATPAMAAAMLAPQIGGYGLGFDIERRGGELVFGHSGLNAGFESRLVASGTAQGRQIAIAVMTSGEGGTPIAEGLIRAAARAHGWSAFAPQTVRQAELPAAKLAGLAGLYRHGPRSIGIELYRGNLYLRDGDWRRGRMIPLSAADFAANNRQSRYRFEPARGSLAQALTVIDDAGEERFERAPGIADALRAGRLVVSIRGEGQRLSVPLAPRAAGAGDARIRLRAGRYVLRIADRDGAAGDLGAGYDQPALVPGRANLLASNGDDLEMTIAADGLWQFTLRAAAGRPASLRLSRASPD